MALSGRTSEDDDARGTLHAAHGWGGQIKQAGGGGEISVGGGVTTAAKHAGIGVVGIKIVSDLSHCAGLGGRHYGRVGGIDASRGHLGQVGGQPHCNRHREDHQHHQQLHQGEAGPGIAWGAPATKPRNPG